ncbi:MAG: ATP-binding protein [Chloroflexi bacterium]|nr:ATP-binding protein [Chloroflexota bacterium]
MSTGVSASVAPAMLFGSADEYARAMLGWLHRLLAWRVSVTQHTYGALADDEYRGLYIPDSEVAVLSAGLPSLPEPLADRRRALAAERDAIEARLAASAAEYGSARFPFWRLGHLFNLDRFERDVLLLALAPEFDLRYERLYAYLQDDVTRKRPLVDLALRLLCLEPSDIGAARAAFLPSAPLLRHALVQLVEDGQRQPALLSRVIKIDDRVVNELLGYPTLDAMLAPFTEIVQPERSFTELVLVPDLIDRLRQTCAPAAGGVVLALQGSYGSGRQAIAEALCADIGVPLLAVDLERLVRSDQPPLDLTQRLVREARLRGAAILWQGADGVLRDDALAVWRKPVLAALDAHDGLSILALELPWEARGALRQRRFLRVEVPVTSYTERETLWQQRLNGDSPGEMTLQALSSTFRLTGGQIRDAIAMARSLARWHNRPLATDDLYAACRAQSSGRLDNLAHKIRTTYTWDDIVLPTDQIGQLREISVQVRHRRTVLESWGFDRHLAMGKGVNALFAGQSGTGKTMAADIIAADLGLELYKVDLSTIVSKYIGETEKNLDGIFRAAREANAILFFDEADALFGKRSEVKDAHDRYANIEVGYLLQKMEEYDGVVILATNLRKNLDDAFVRRLHISIDFPFPEEPDRLRIWQKVFPVEAPLAPDVDLGFCARQFKLAGGSIRNVALLAAFLAAEDGRHLHMIHIARATKREYQKLGKLVTEADFGRYLSLMRADATPAGI